MRFSWTYKRQLAAVCGVVFALHSAGITQAQFAPISNPSQVQGQPGAFNPAAQTYGQPQVYGQLNAAQTQPQQTTPVATTPLATTNKYFAQVPAQSYVQAPQAAQQQSVQQPNVAYQPTTPVASQAPGYVQPHSAPQYTAMNNPVATMPQPVAETVVQGAPAANCNCNPAPAVNYAQSSPVSCYGSCDTTGCGYNTFQPGCGVGNGCLPNRGCRNWFGGIYGLYMNAELDNWVPLAFATSTANAPPYYPTDSEIVLSTASADIGYQSGIEIRFGSTLGGRFGGGSCCGTTGCDTGYNTFAGGCCGMPAACGCGPTLAWEVGYWGLLEEEDTVYLTDTLGDATRTYGMMDFRGLEYDPGTGYRPVNDYYDYGPPTVDHSTPTDVEVRRFTVRRRFSMQNVELNLLRLPILNGCSTGGCGGCGPRYEVTTLAGARFIRVDDDFLFATDYENTGTSATGSLGYNSEVDNTLYGFQLGCNGLCRFGACGRWALHCNTAVGVYGNDIEARQWMTSPTGDLRYSNNGNPNFDVSSSEDEFSMVGELRLGASYQYSCNWRFYGGWRFLGMTGLALAPNQAPAAFITPAQTGRIYSDGSVLVHGLQAGVECTY